LDWAKEHMYIAGSGANPWGALVKWTYTATSNTPYLYWWSSIIVPYKSAHLSIPCPISGTITLYDYSTTSSTTICTANGINFLSLNRVAFLYYVIDPTNPSAAYSQNNFRLIISSQTRRDLMANGTIDPNSWILIAIETAQYDLIFKPMDVTIYYDETRYSNGSGDVITGNKNFNGTTRTISLENPGNTAQKTLSGGGNVTFSSSGYIRWDADVVVINTDKSFLPQGYHRITNPTSGTITHFKSDNTTTTVTCTSEGIPIVISATWTALYYVITNGMGPATVNAQFRVVDYDNSTFRVNDNWILIALVNRDASPLVLKWMPAMIYIPQGSSYLSTSISMSTNTTQTITGTKSFNTNTLKAYDINCLDSYLNFTNSSSTSLSMYFNNKLGTSTTGWVTLDPNGGGATDTGLAIWDHFIVGGSSTFNNTRITNNNVLEFGFGIAGKNGDAGKIGYEVWDAGCLNIVGAAASGAVRKVKVYDNLIVNGNLTANNFVADNVYIIDSFLLARSAGTVTSLILSNPPSGLYRGLVRVYNTNGTIQSLVEQFFIIKADKTIIIDASTRTTKIGSGVAYFTNGSISSYLGIMNSSGSTLDIYFSFIREGNYPF